VSTAAEVAAAFNLTSRRINQLAKEGTLPRLGRGAYDLMACALAYIHFLQKAVAAKATMDAGGRVTSTTQQRSALLDVELQREQLSLARERGELLMLVDHEAILSDLIVETKANIMAVGPRVAPRLVNQGSSATIQATIDAAQKEALSRLAAIVPRRPGARSRPAKAAKPARPKAPGKRLQTARGEFAALLAGLRDERARAMMAPPVVTEG
jgi:hypothetical protein